MALDIGDPDLGDEQRCRLLIDLADARWRSSDLEGCRTACEKAVALAHRIGRPDLVGDVALTVEPIGDLAWDLNVRRWCDDALSAAPGSERAYRARLLARATEASIYLGEHAAADQASRTALALAGRRRSGGWNGAPGKPAGPSLYGICCARRRRWPRRAASSPLPWSWAGPRSTPSAPSATRQRWAPT
jgi:hypothetical protein